MRVPRVPKASETAEILKTISSGPRSYFLSILNTHPRFVFERLRTRLDVLEGLGESVHSNGFANSQFLKQEERRLSWQSPHSLAKVNEFGTVEFPSGKILRTLQKVPSGNDFSLK